MTTEEAFLLVDILPLVLIFIGLVVYKTIKESNEVENMTIKAEFSTDITAHELNRLNQVLGLTVEVNNGQITEVRIKEVINGKRKNI